MKKITYSLFLLCAICLTSCYSNTKGIIDNRDYGTSGRKDYTPIALQMIDDAKANNISKIIIAPGTYHFYPDKAFEKYCHISNHDDGLRRTPFPIIGFDGLEIFAEGAKFIFHGLIVPFIIEDSKYIRLSGFSIDWQLPLASEALVVESDKLNKSFDLQISPDQPYEIRNEELIFLKEGYEHNLDRSIYWDPKTMAVAYKTVRYGPSSTRSVNSVTRFLETIESPYEQDPLLPVNIYRGQSNSLPAEELKSGLVRISMMNTHLDPPPVGLVMVSKGLNGYNRWAPAIRILRTDDLEINNVSIYSAGGMGVIAEMSSDITLDNVRVEPSPGTGRMLSTSADATHFVNCRGIIKLTNSLFANQLDDATNVHGAFLRVEEQIDNYHVGAFIGHFQQRGFDFGISGDEIAFIDYENSYNSAFTATLESIRKVNDRYYILEFNDKLPVDENVSYVIENISAYPELEITNCSIINNRARGILLSTPKRIIVENNYFNTMMAAIYVPKGISHWYESGAVNDLIIRNNVFGDCAYGGNSQSVINISTNYNGEDFIFRNIHILDNEFNTFDAAILSANKVKGLTFNGNTILTSGTYPPLFPNAPVVSIRGSKDIEIKNNHFGSGFSNTLQLDEFSEEHVVLENNNGL